MYLFGYVNVRKILMSPTHSADSLQQQLTERLEELLYSLSLKKNLKCNNVLSWLAIKFKSSLLPDIFKPLSDLVVSPFSKSVLNFFCNAVVSTLRRYCNLKKDCWTKLQSMVCQKRRLVACLYPMIQKMRYHCLRYRFFCLSSIERRKFYMHTRGPI